MKRKSNVSILFPKFKSQVANYFQTVIKSIYLDGGDEYDALKFVLSSYGIQHLQKTPYTPEHNGLAERRHMQIVEIGLTLLHQTSLPLKY